MPPPCTPLCHPTWTISPPVLPPPAPLPTVFTPLLEELGLASLQSYIQSTAAPDPPIHTHTIFSQEEIDWFCALKPLSNEVKAQRCHISLWPVTGRVSLRGRGMCSCIKGYVFLNAHSISWTSKWWEFTEVFPCRSLMNLRLQSFSLNSLK